MQFGLNIREGPKMNLIPLSRQHFSFKFSLSTLDQPINPQTILLKLSHEQAKENFAHPSSTTRSTKILSIVGEHLGRSSEVAA